jgi:aminoglycoside/choline kinase family phosphotransferase
VHGIVILDQIVENQLVVQVNFKFCLEFSKDILKIETSILSDYYAFSHNY